MCGCDKFCIINFTTIHQDTFWDSRIKKLWSREEHFSVDLTGIMSWSYHIGPKNVAYKNKTTMTNISWTRIYVVIWYHPFSYTDRSSRFIWSAKVSLRITLRNFFVFVWNTQPKWSVIIYNGFSFSYWAMCSQSNSKWVDTV